MRQNKDLTAFQNISAFQTVGVYKKNLKDVQTGALKKIDLFLKTLSL